MISYKFLKYSKSNIEKLKQNLMTSEKTFSDASKSVISSIRQVDNEKIAKLFERNIGHILEYYYGFEKLNIPRKMFMKTIIYENIKEKEIIQGFETTVTIEKKTFIFLFDKNFDLKIKNESGDILDEIPSKFSKDKMTLKIKETNITISISPYSEIEADGFFAINSFSIKQFNDDEVTILYSNVDDKESNNFKYCNIEAKLSPDKINKLISQIRRGAKVLKYFDKKPVISLGFINSNKIKDNNYLKDLKNKKCVIYGINNSVFWGKDINQFIDWDLELKVKKLSNDFQVLLKKVNEISEYIKKEKEKEMEEIVSSKEKKGKGKIEDKKEEEKKTENNEEQNQEMKEFEEEEEKKEKVEKQKKGKEKEMEEKEEKEEKEKKEKKLLGKKYGRNFD